jgi:hypothetical protein
MHNLNNDAYHYTKIFIIIKQEDKIKAKWQFTGAHYDELHCGAQMWAIVKAT